MTYKKNQNRNQYGKQHSDKHEVKKMNKFWKSRQFIISVIAVVIIVFIVIIAVTNPFFAAPTSISPDKYYKISDHDLLSNGSTGIYFISWLGCPIGATDSWALYYAMNSTTDIYSHVEYHEAYNQDIYANAAATAGQPGLLFKGTFSFQFNGKKVTFYPLYMYNQTMKGTVNNVSLSPSDLASYGLSLINSTLPSGVAKMFNKYASDITYDHHLETTFIITGPHGAYILNSFMYNPAILGTGTWTNNSSTNTYSPYPPESVMPGLNSDSTIVSAAHSFEKNLTAVQ